jgi:hypothetical protein
MNLTNFARRFSLEQDKMMTLVVKLDQKKIFTAALTLSTGSGSEAISVTSDYLPIGR